MIPHAGAYCYHSDWNGVVTPDDPLPVVERALRRYDVRRLALEGAHVTMPLRPVLAVQARPDWLAEPLIEVPPLTRGDSTADMGDEVPLPQVARLAVGLDENDTRCGA